MTDSRSRRRNIAIIGLFLVTLLCAGGLFFLTNSGAKAEQETVKHEVVAAAPKADAIVVADATPAPTPAPTVKPPDATPTPEVVISIGQPKPPVPDVPWTLNVITTVRDLNGNVLDGWTLQGQAVDDDGNALTAMSLIGGQRVTYSIPKWPAGLAMGGQHQQSMLARGMIVFPKEPMGVLPWKANSALDFKDPERRPLDPVAQTASAAVRTAASRPRDREEMMRRMVRNMGEDDTTPPFQLEGDSRAYAGYRAELEGMELDADLTSPTSNTLTLNVSVRAAFLGKIEATIENFGSFGDASAKPITNGEELAAAEADPNKVVETNTLIGIEVARAIPEIRENLENGRSPFGPPTANDDERFVSITLDRPSRGGGRGPGGDQEPPTAAPVQEGGLAAMRPGGEPRAYRLAQRAALMDEAPTIDKNVLKWSNVPPGEYQISVLTDKGRKATSQRFQVVEFETAKISLRLDDGAGLKVEVVTKTEEGVKPVAEAQVRVRSAGGFGGRGGFGGGRGGNQTGISYNVNATGQTNLGEGVQQVKRGTTDGQGVAKFLGLEAGPHDVEVTHKDYAEMEKRVTISPKGEQTLRIELFSTKARVKFRVVTGAGMDVPEGTVTASEGATQGWRRGRRFPGPGGSSAEVKQGQAELLLGYGTWSFTAEAPGYQDATLSGIALNDPGPHEITLTLPFKVPVTIEVIYGDAPGVDQTVTMFSTSESTFGPTLARTNEAGIATFDLAPGSYAGYVNSRFIKVVDVVIDRDNVFQLKLGGLTVEGYVHDKATGNVVGGAQIRMVPQLSDNDPANTVPSFFRDPRGRTNETGLFRFLDVAEGSYKIEIVARGFASMTSPTMQLDATSAATPLRFDIEALQGMITGVIRRPDGTPIEGVFVRSLVNETGESYPINFRNAMSNAEGRYRLTGLSAGIYVAEFAAPRWISPGYLPHMSDAIDVVAGEEQNYDLVLEPAGELRISVRDERDVAVQGVRVTLIDSSGAAVQLSHIDSPEPISDAAGEVRWTALAPGVYTVRGSGANRTQIDPAPEVSVESDQSARVTVRMSDPS